VRLLEANIREFRSTAHAIEAPLDGTAEGRRPGAGDDEGKAN
jgi:hypothetical protein